MAAERSVVSYSDLRRAVNQLAQKVMGETLIDCTCPPKYTGRHFVPHYLNQMFGLLIHNMCLWFIYSLIDSALRFLFHSGELMGSLLMEYFNDQHGYGLEGYLETEGDCG